MPKSPALEKKTPALRLHATDCDILTCKDAGFARLCSLFFLTLFDIYEFTRSIY